LAHAGFDAVQAPKNLNRSLHPRGLPTGDGFQFGQHRLEPNAQVRQDVIGIARKPVTGVERGGGPADQHGVRRQALQAGGGG
jgi:hypothetical protein